MLLSQHRDADILARVAYHLGFDCVRGSTYRGGARAIWELSERSQRQHLTITPDGPRGPRRQLAQGPIYLASRLQLPLVVMGFGYDRPWRANSWDRFAVPRPFSRARAVIGPPLMLPPDLNRAGLEQCRRRVERLAQLTSRAKPKPGPRPARAKRAKSSIAPRHAPLATHVCIANSIRRDAALARRMTRMRDRESTRRPLSGILIATAICRSTPLPLAA